MFAHYLVHSSLKHRDFRLSNHLFKFKCSILSVSVYSNQDLRVFKFSIFVIPLLINFCINSHLCVCLCVVHIGRRLSVTVCLCDCLFLFLAVSLSVRFCICQSVAVTVCPLSISLCQGLSVLCLVSVSVSPCV